MKASAKKFGEIGAVLYLSGEIDLYSTNDLWKMVSSILELGRKHLIIDFSTVDYLDSSGVGVIIRLLQELKKVGGKLLVAGLQGMPKQVLQMSNIISLLQLCDNVEQGRTMFGHAASKEE